MLTVVLWPAVRVTGRLGAVSTKYLVEMAAPLTVTEADPVFVAMTLNALLLPAVTLPKSRLAAVSDRVPDCWPPEGGPALTPWQPTMRASPARRSSTPAASRRHLA